MKRFLMVAFAALLLSSVASAQFRTRIGSDTRPPQAVPLEKLIDARAKLIQWYVISSSHYAWGVSVCGGNDLFTDEDYSYLTIYVYKDSLKAFAADFDKASTRNPGGSRGVDGITVVVQVIERPKKGAANEPAKTERNDRQSKHSNGSGSVALPSRPSRS
jgi:hypothetical protein